MNRIIFLSVSVLKKTQSIRAELIYLVTASEIMPRASGWPFITKKNRNQYHKKRPSAYLDKEEIPEVFYAENYNRCRTWRL